MDPIKGSIKKMKKIRPDRQYYRTYRAPNNKKKVTQK
jgi:hypothetical protein